MSVNSNIEQRRRELAEERATTARFLGAVFIFVILWPLVRNLLGCGVMAILEPQLVRLPHSFGQFFVDVATLLIIGYAIDLVPAAFAGTLIAWVQLRYRRLNTLYIFLVAVVTALIPPFLFVDKDLPAAYALVGSAVSFVSTLLCCVAIRRYWILLRAGASSGQ